MKYGWIRKMRAEGKLPGRPDRAPGGENGEEHALDSPTGRDSWEDPGNSDLIDLAVYPVERRAVEKIPKQMALKYSALAVSSEGNRLTVAIGDPANLYALEDIRLVTNMHIRLVRAQKDDIARAIDLFYAEVDARMAVNRANQSAAAFQSGLPHMEAGVDADPSPIVRLLNSLLLKGYNTDVSDIHIEPYEGETMIRMRRDGMLLPYMTLSPVLHHGLIARTKILAQMDIAEKRRPQDGHFNITLEGARLSVRVSLIPTAYGEKGVLRLLTTNTRIDHGDTFGMNQTCYEQMTDLLKVPHGIIYLTGPTGSGKTTTLYSILSYLSDRAVNIVTIEDPIERSLPGVSQIQVNLRAGITFDNGLRSLLRQDPDIIMVGETRDFETAAISARAAITGHLVLSTLHTNDAASSIVRILDMGIPSYLAADSLAGIVAQRLVRKICPHCKEAYEPAEEEMRMVSGSGLARSGKIYYRGKGCHLCDQTGYRGRTAVHEILGVDAKLRRMIADGEAPEELAEYARTFRHMTPLKEEIRRLVEEGVTTAEEMARLTYSLDET